MWLGCDRSAAPLIPADAQVWAPDLARADRQNLPEYWSEAGPVAMRAAAAEVDSFLEWSGLGTDGSPHLGWYRVSPDQWGAVIYAPLTSSLDWQALGATVSRYETYRGQLVRTIERPGFAPVFQTQWQGWSMWAWQPSLLQDVLLAQKRDGQPLPVHLSWQQRIPFFSDNVTCQQISVSPQEISLRSSVDWNLGELPVFNLNPFPDFLTEGYALSDYSTPYGMQDIWFAAHQKEGEFFLWIPDTSRQIAEWWEIQFLEKGEIQSYQHQGLNIRQLLDNSWEKVNLPMATGSLRNPFVARLPEGWLLSNSEIGTKRWIAYLLAGRFHGKRWGDAVPTGYISGWAAGSTPWLQELSARSGLQLADQWALLTQDEDTLHIYRMERSVTTPDLYWQYSILSAPIRQLSGTKRGVLVEDQAALQLINKSGRQQWRIPLDDSIQSQIIRIEEAGRSIWAFGTASQIIALDDAGEFLPGFPYAVPQAPIMGWTFMRGSDGYARFFWQEANGLIRGVTSQLSPCAGWPVDAGDGVLSGYLQTEEEDVFFVLAPRLWSAYNLEGRLLWSVNAPGEVAAAEATKNQLTVLLASGELGALTPEGTYATLANNVLSFSVYKKWLFLRRTSDIAVGTFPVNRDTFRARYRLPQKVDQLLGGAAAFQIFLGGSQNGKWHIYTLEGRELAASPLPSQTRPVLSIDDAYVRVVTNQGDRVVAYRWSLAGD